MNCLNENTKEFKSLVEEVGIDKNKLKALIGIMQAVDGVDSMPSSELIEEYLSKNSKIRESYRAILLSNAAADKIIEDGNTYSISPGAYDFLADNRPTHSVFSLMNKSKLSSDEADFLRSNSLRVDTIGNTLESFKSLSPAGVDQAIVNALISKFKDNKGLFDKKIYYVSSGKPPSKVVVHGKYSGIDIFIDINSNLYSNLLSQPALLMHEILHSLTASALYDNPGLSRAISNHIRQIKGSKIHLESLKTFMTKGAYDDIINAIEDENPHEFLAEFYSSAAFRGFLKSINGVGQNRLVSIFKAIINAIAEFLFDAPVFSDRFTSISDTLESVLNLAANEYADILNETVDLNQDSLEKRTWAATRDADEFIANVEAADSAGTFISSDGRHDYFKDGDKYPSITEEMRRRGITKEYDNKNPDPSIPDRSNIGSSVHSLLNIWAISQQSGISVDEVDTSKLRDFIEPPNGDAGWAEGVKDGIYEIFDNSFGRMIVLGCENKLFSKRGKRLAGSYDIKLMSSSGVSFTIDLKTTVKSHTYKNGRVATYKGFSGYRNNPRGGGMSKESEHATQLFSYRRLDIQNNTQTDIYGTLLLEISTVELEDGSYQITNVDLGGPSASMNDGYGIVELKETPIVHENVMLVSGEADLSTRPELSEITVGGSKIKIIDIVNDIFTGLDYKRKLQLSFSDIIHELENKYTQTGDVKYSNYSNEISRLLEENQDDKNIIDINRSIDRIHKSILIARQMMSEFNYRASASSMSDDAYNIQARQSHYDVLTPSSLEEISRQISILIDDIDLIKNQALHSGISDMDLLKTIDKLLIKLEAYKEIDDIVGFISGETRISEAANDFYFNLLDSTKDANKRSILNSISSLQNLSSNMIRLKKDLEDVRANRFAIMLANSNGFDYEHHMRIQYRNDFIKDWRKNNPDANARKDPNFKKDRDEFIEKSIASLKESGDYYRNEIDWFKSQISSAAYDISRPAAYLQAVQDNSDPIVAASNSRYNAINLNRYESEREFGIRMEELRAALYKAKGYTSFTDPKDIYAFMVQIPEAGEKKTVVNKFFKRVSEDNSAKMVRTPEQSYKDALKIKKRELFNSGYSREDVMAKLEEWINKYAPISSEDIIKVKADLLALYKKEYKDGKISEDDLKQLKIIESLPNSHMRYLYEFFRNGKLSDRATELLEDRRADMLMSARSLSSDLYSDKYNKIMNLDGVIQEEKDLYEFIVDHVDMMDSSMPIEKRLNDNLPGVTKQKTESFITGDFDNYFRLLREKLSFKLNKSSEFHQFNNLRKVSDLQGNILESVPVYYLNSVPVEEQSFDIPKIFTMWFQQANNYMHVTAELPYFRYADEILDRRDVPQLDSKGNLIANKAIAMIGERLSPKNAIKSRSNNTATQYHGWMTNEIYRTSDISGSERAQAIIKSINWLVTMRGLGLNIPAVITNAVQGEIQNLYKLFGGKYITWGNFVKAFNDYSKNSISTISDWNSIEKKGEVNLISEYFGILPLENTTPSMNSNRLMRQFAQNAWGTSLVGFSIGEHAVQMQFTLAYLMGIDAYDKSSNKIGNLREMMSKKDGISGLSIDERLHSVKIGERMMNWGDGSARNLISSKLDQIMRGMHQNNKSHTRILLDANVYTKPFLAFRRWIPGTMEHMYGQHSVDPRNPRYSSYSDEIRIGRIISFRNFVWNKWRARVMEQIDAIGWVKNEQKRAEYQQRIADLKDRSDSAYMNDIDESNIREVYAVIGLASAFTAGVFALEACLRRERLRRKHYSANPERDRRSALAFILYVTERARMEQMFYFNPKDLFNIFRSPAPAFDLIETYADLAIYALAPISWSSTMGFNFKWNDTYQGGQLHGKNKLLHKGLKAMPLASQIYGLQYMNDRLRALGID